MKGKVYIARRKGELDSATRATAREQSEAWWNDCLRDGGYVLEIEYDDSTLSARVFKHYLSDGSEVGIPAGSRRMLGVGSVPKEPAG